LPALAVSALLAAWLWQLQRHAPAPERLEIFARLFVFHDAPAALAFVPLLGLACIPALQALGLRAARVLGEHPLASAAATGLALAFGARFVYAAHPLSLDEYSHWFQSELFAAGRLTASAPPLLLDRLLPLDMQAYFFSASRATGQIASGYWPGFSLLMTPFAALGAPWLANPLLSAATLWLVQRSALQLFGSVESAGIASLLTLGSAAFAINGMSYYAMPAQLLASLAFALLLAEPSARRALAAGAVGSLALTLHNPLPHALFALPWVVWLLARGDRLRTLPALAAGYLPLTGLLGIGWSRLLGELSGSAGGTAARLGALETFFSWPNPEIAIARVVGLAKLWLWAAPGALVLAALGARASFRDVRLRLWTLSALLTLAGYAFVAFDQGHGWGYRYFHSAWAAIPLLAVAALPRAPEAAPSRSSLAGFACAAALASLIALTPLRSHQVHAFIEQHLAQLPRAESGRAELMLLETADGNYLLDLVQNHPSFVRPPLVMESQGAAADARLLGTRFPGLVRLGANEHGEVWGRR
jgi:hypothetical protein